MTGNEGMWAGPARESKLTAVILFKGTKRQNQIIKVQK